MYKMSINNTSLDNICHCCNKVIESMKAKHPYEYWIIYDQAFCGQVENNTRHDYKNISNQVAIFGKSIKDFTPIEREAFDDAEYDIDYYFELGAKLDTYELVKKLLDSY